MTAKELLRAGDLRSATIQATQEVEARAADSQARTLLFELLCFAGDLDRAGKQLDVLADLTKDGDEAVRRYREILKAEALRRSCFSNGALPASPVALPENAALYLEAIACVRGGRFDEAGDLLSEAEESRKPGRGTLNGEAFEDFRDCDDSLPPFLEAFVGDAYCWVPWESIQSLSCEPAVHLRDLLWMPARIKLHHMNLGEAFLPCLYPGTHLGSNDQLRLGRMTEWREIAGEMVLGSGQKIFAADDREIPVLEIRQLDFEEMEAAHGAVRTP